MRPSSGTGHSTSPATSSSRPGSSTSVTCRAVRQFGDAVADDPPAFVGIDHARGARAASPPSRRRMPRRMRPGRGSDGPRSGRPRPARAHRPRRRADRTAPPRRPAGRRCAAAGGPRRSCWLPPQRIDLGQGKRRSSGGIAPAISVAAGTASAVFSQHPVVAFLAQSARGSRRACAGSLRPPAPERWCAGRVRLCCRRRPAAPPRRPARCGAGRGRTGRLPGASDDSASAHDLTRSSAARACMRAGISSLNNSRKSSGIVSPSAPARCRSREVVPLKAGLAAALGSA